MGCLFPWGCIPMAVNIFDISRGIFLDLPVLFYHPFHANDDSIYPIWYPWIRIVVGIQNAMNPVWDSYWVRLFVVWCLLMHIPAMCDFVIISLFNIVDYRTFLDLDFSCLERLLWACIDLYFFPDDAIPPSVMSNEVVRQWCQMKWLLNVEYICNTRFWLT